MSPEKEILNKMRIVTDIFLKTLKTVNEITIEIDQYSKREIDNCNCSIENRPVYKIFNETFNITTIENLISLMEPLLTEIENENDNTCEKHEFVEDRIETGLDNDMMTINYCKFCSAFKR